MSYLQEALLKREKELSNLIMEVKTDLSNAPAGQLRISNSRKNPEYYYRVKDTGSHFRNGTYIRKENERFAYQLAQKDYDRKLLETAERQIMHIQKLLKKYHADDLQNVYDSMNPCRKSLVTPKIINDKMFAEQWEQVEYQGKFFADGSAELYTEKGERVRSKSEKIIADMLYRKGIRYRYEYPLILPGIGTVYPDFTVLNLKNRQEIYWEHLGMMDDTEYCERALYKLNCYMKNGICLGDRLLISYETLKRPLETAVIEKMIKVNFPVM